LTTEGSELNTSHYEVRNNSQPFVSTLTRNSESLELFIPYTMSGLLAFSSSVASIRLLKMARWLTGKQFPQQQMQNAWPACMS
jgi:hypothetical protein